MRILLDTCIIIDALQSREPFAKDAQAIFLSAAAGEFEAFLTAKEMTDIYYLTHHALHSREQTEQIIYKLFSLFQILDTVASDIQQAIASPMSDYEDAVMVETALREEMDAIVTRNLDDYQKATLPVYSPADFLARISQ